MNKPIFTIITPNYNSASFIKETIKSVQSQTNSNWEHIIVDDGSQDNSCQIIKKESEKDERIRLLYRKSQVKGASVCRNIGIENASGDYIIFLDSDDLIAPFCLEQRGKLMQQNPTLDFAIFPMEIFHNKPKDTNQIVNKYAADKDYLTMFLKYDLPWAITCPIWKTSFLKKNNIRFDERYQRLQDPEFHSKILLNHKPGFMVVKEANPDCFYRFQTQKPLFNECSVNNIIEGFTLYVSDVKGAGKVNEMSSFFSNSVHTLLFNYKQQKFSLIKKYIQIFSKNEQTFSLRVIYLFFLFNKIGFTFKKGFGISRLWNILNGIKQ